ncbi:reverse transcriptase domain-containing protein [Tanacetum coccineum]|uniref:Reverse transcriptase domain-containing protein n=1 Tax=Tanacetum coccineum TaxID=301880 RepID=A0ABQ5G279_9ASTR
MTTQSFRCKTCAHIHTTVSEVIKKVFIQGFRTISENQCLLQILKVTMIGRRDIIKAFKDSNRYEHVRLKISVWQSQSERRSQKPRNVRLGLAVDGFNPFGNLSQSYSMWPVILTTYNLPPWLYIKESSFMLTLLIHGPKSPGKDINVYLRPLIDDLKDLWAKPGVETIDVATGLKFNMRAMVLWTINDFPARSSLSGWSGQGYRVCPTYNEDTPSVCVLGKTAYVGHRRFLKKPHKLRRSLEFNGETENGEPPREFNRDAIMTQLARLPTRVKGKHPRFGGVKIKCNVLVFKSLCKLIGLRSVSRIDHQELKKVIWYVLHNIPEIDTYLAKFKRISDKNERSIPRLVWKAGKLRLTVQRHIDNDPGVSESSCVVNGVRFVVHSRDERRTTQNSGICSPGPDGEMYYGQLEQILEFSYLSFKTVLFRVKWFDTSNKGRIKNLVIRNNITQIKVNGEAFKNDQYILTTQVKQCFYLEDMARRPLGWKVVEHVSHKKFLNGGVIVVEDDPDVIHVDNSSDLALSTSLNDLEIAALHIDGQSIDVDAPPDIIDVVDEDDDIIDEEDPIPHDLADSDDEDLVNLDIDDGVNVMSADVARGHGGDGGGDDRPPSHHIPTGCGGCLGNRGKGTRKPNLGGRRAGRQHTRQETRNLGLKAITDKSGPVSIRFEFGDRETLMPLGEHAAHWANYLRELVQELPLLHLPSGVKCQRIAEGGDPSLTCVPMESIAGHLSIAAIQQHLQKITVAEGCLLRKGMGFLTRTGLTTWSASDYHVLRTFLRSIGMRKLRSGMIPRTVPGRPKINKTGQKERAYADKDPGLLPPFEICM